MQVVVIIASLFCYGLLLWYYRTVAVHGAEDLAAALSKNGLLQLLNWRNLNVTALLAPLFILYLLDVRGENFLQFKWSRQAAVPMLLLLCTCGLVSVLAALQIKSHDKIVVGRKEIARYFSIRVPGLVIYEIFFRGILLGLALWWMPPFAAVAVNLVLYAVAHAFGPRKEFIGSLPFGLLLCWTTLYYGSVYPAVLLHLSLALPYEILLFTRAQLPNKKMCTGEFS